MEKYHRSEVRTCTEHGGEIVSTDVEEINYLGHRDVKVSVIRYEGCDCKAVNVFEFCDAINSPEKKSILPVGWKG